MAVLRLAAVGVSRSPSATAPTRRWLAIALAAVAVGMLSAALTPVAVAGALFGVAALALVWSRPSRGVLLFVAVSAVLPFGVIPVQIGVQLTLVDAVLIVTYAAVVLRLILPSSGPRVALGVPGLLLVAFGVVALAAFGLGAAGSAIPAEQIRRFAKLMASVLLFLLVRTLIGGPSDLYRLTRWLMVGGAIQGGIAAGLLALSPLTQLDLLTSLGAVGYPTTDVLRYVPGPNDTYTDQIRAVGTSVDPNVLGGTLMLALLLLAIQFVAPRPILGRGWLLLLGLPTLAGVLLSLSRASWVGLAAGLAVVGVLRYRRILALGAVGLMLLLVSPIGYNLVLRFASGFSIADRATAFRVGEFANALTLIQRYPLLGIGFGASPDIDVTAGVSSVYLLVGEQTGLFGLALFLAVLVAVVWAGMQRVRRKVGPRLDGVVAAFLAAVSGAVVTGLLDQYFANQAFPHAVALFWLYAAALSRGGELVPDADDTPG